MNARKHAPRKTTRWSDPTPFRVWLNEPTFEGDPKPWKCLAAFYYLSEALDYIAKCQDTGRNCVHQSPAYTREITPSEQRVVYKPECA